MYTALPHRGHAAVPPIICPIVGTLPWGLAAGRDVGATGPGADDAPAEAAGDGRGTGVEGAWRGAGDGAGAGTGEETAMAPNFAAGGDEKEKITEIL